nr:hypothetical protein [Micromonospora sp. DSM 115978]
VRLGPSATEFADDPAIATFRRRAALIGPALLNPNGNHEELVRLTTGQALSDLQAQLREYSDNNWTLAGTAEIEIVDLRVVDELHHHVLACELDSAAYAIDASGQTARPVEGTWLPQEHWFVLSDGSWKLEQYYRGVHLCEG